MNRIAPLLVLQLTLVSSPFTWDRAVDFRIRSNGAKRADIGEVVGIDSSGNVIAEGDEETEKQNSHRIAEYDRASGKQVSTSRLFGNRGFDRVHTIAVGSDGSVYVAKARAKNTLTSRASLNLRKPAARDLGLRHSLIH